MRSKGFVALMVCLLLAACKEKPRQVAESPVPVGKIVAITDAMLAQGGCDTLHVGRLYSGEQALVHFRLQNATPHPVVVLGHKLTCGCIHLSYENKPLIPREELPVEMRFDSRGLDGWQLKLFRLNLHDAQAPLKIYVEAEVEQGVGN